MSGALRRPALAADRTADVADACGLDAVTVAYAGRTAVGPVTLAVPAGQAVALVGPSGAGKTTVLRLLAGQVAPDAGTVSLHGRDLSRLHGRTQLPALVGLLPQRFDLVPQLSVRHNVQAGALGRWGLLRSLAALLLPLEHPPAREAVRRVGLSDVSATRVADLSGGEQQRVALARLLVQDPSVLLADEPVASLDPARADQLLLLLRGMAADDERTLVASLHTPSWPVATSTGSWDCATAGSCSTCRRRGSPTTCWRACTGCWRRWRARPAGSRMTAAVLVPVRPRPAHRSLLTALLVTAFVARAVTVVATRGVLATLRAVHELIWALLLLTVLRLHPLSGVLAIGIPYGATMARVLGDRLLDVPRAPLDALTSAGATPWQLLLYGRLPLAAADLTGYLFYRLECAVRAAAVLSFIGLGGIGLRIEVALADLRFDQVGTLLLALLLLVVGVDATARAARARLVV